MTMIEKVARALHKSFGYNDWIDDNVECRYCLLAAKAAIEAMLEPTEAMICCAESQFALFKDEYQRAIRAALEGK